MQPERVGPYCTIFNPGYDRNLPLYDPGLCMMPCVLPMCHAWSAYAGVDRKAYEAPATTPAEKYKEVVLCGNKK